MFRRILFILPVFSLALLALPSFASAEAIDLDTLMAAKAPQKEITSGSATTVTSDQADIKDIIKTPNETEEKEMTDKEKEAEKQKLTKNLNYLLIEAYKGKVDKIFGNLSDNIKRYPPEVQIRILRQVGDSVGAKIEIIDEKGNEISTNRKEILTQVLSYIRSLVQAKIAKVNAEK